MKESELYINFLKRNWVWFLLPLIASLILSIYFYAQVPTKFKFSQTFKMDYELQNIESMLALTDQAVAELRTQKFDQVFPNSLSLIFKSSPLNITVETISLTRDNSYSLLLKESDYLKQNFKVSELSNPEIILIEPNLFKYLISGLIIGGFAGLVISLAKEYLRNY